MMSAERRLRCAYLCVVQVEKGRCFPVGGQAPRRVSLVIGWEFAEYGSVWLLRTLVVYDIHILQDNAIIPRCPGRLWNVTQLIASIIAHASVKWCKYLLCSPW